MAIELSSNFLAQVGHALGGAVLVYGTVALFGTKWLEVTVPAFVGYAAFKEFYWDVHYETAATAGSGAVDFGFYMVGLAVAGSTLLLKLI